jgi:hypothetical protein
MYFEISEGTKKHSLPKTQLPTTNPLVEKEIVRKLNAFGVENCWPIPGRQLPEQVFETHLRQLERQTGSKPPWWVQGKEAPNHTLFRRCFSTILIALFFSGRISAEMLALASLQQAHRPEVLLNEYVKIPCFKRKIKDGARVRRKEKNPKKKNKKKNKKKKTRIKEKQTNKQKYIHV